MSAKSFVDANYRFVAAYQEVNARINQRQQALALYVTLVVSLLAALVALRIQLDSSVLPVEWLVQGFPVAAACLALLNHKSERAITNLRQFLCELEQLEDAHLHLPSYNTDARWAAQANKARRFHDHACAVLMVGGSGVGLASAWNLYPNRFGASAWPLWVSAGVTLISVGITLLSTKWHYLPKAGKA